MENFKVPTIIENPLLATGYGSRILKDIVQFAFKDKIKTTIYDARNNPYTINESTVTKDMSETGQISKFTGNYIFSNIVINEGRYFKDDKAELVDYWNDFVINDCLVQVSQSKKIITTEIQGRDGTVKEYIGMDDYQVNIIGRLNGTNGVNPKQQTKQLNDILKAPVPLGITSWWLQLLGIKYIVVKDYNISQAEGSYSTVFFTINALSDNPVEVLITGQK